MKVWTCNSFTGYWGVGTSAVVVADSAFFAALSLNSRLRGIGLPGDATEADMKEIDTSFEQAIILNDGNY